MRRASHIGVAALLAAGGFAVDTQAQTDDDRVFMDGEPEILGFIEIDMVRSATPLIPLFPAVPTPYDMERAAYLDDDPTVVDLAVSSDDFTTLVAAVKAAGLAEALSGDGPFTIFAPSDEAFAKLGDETLGRLMMPENKDELAALLSYHVVPGNVFANSEAEADDLVPLASTDRLQTLQGSYLPIAAGQNGYRVGEAVVIKPDLAASNGVIHVIDRVLIPPTEAEF